MGARLAAAGIALAAGHEAAVRAQLDILDRHANIVRRALDEITQEERP